MIGGTVDAENAGWSNTVLSASLTFVRKRNAAPLLPFLT